MNTWSLFAGAIAVFTAMVIGAAPIEAQTCFFCNDEFWTEVSCDSAEWDEFGRTECEVVYGPPRCIMSGATCWGPDPEEQDFALRFGADGTLLSPSTSFRSGVVEAKAMGLSTDARINERTCKGFITLRVYGAALRQELKQQALRITI